MPPFGPLKENTTIQVWHLIAYLIASMISIARSTSRGTVDSLKPWMAQYQTGAPVSRAAFKARAREVSALHHAAEVAHAVAVAAGKMESVETELFPAWDALGIVQHHDAMPGRLQLQSP